MEERKSYGKQLLTNSFFNFVNVLIGRVGGLVFTILLARLLAPELFGLYNLTLSVALIILALANCGIDEALVRYVSTYYESKPKKAKAYFNYLLKLKVYILLSASLLLVILAKPIAWFYGNSSLTFPLIVSALYIIFMSLSQFISALFYVVKDVKKYAIKETLFQISRLALLPIVFTFFTLYLVEGIFIVLAIASFIALTFSTIALIRKERFLFTKKDQTQVARKELFNYLKFLTFGSLTGIIFLYIDVLILGKFVSLESIGFYRAASTVVLSIASVLVITPVLYPIFAQNSGKRLNQLFNDLFYYSTMLTIPASMGVIFIAKHVIRLLYGYEYLPSAVPLYWLALLIFSLGTGDLLIALVNAQGRSKYTARTLVISTIINIVLNFVLIIWLVQYGELYALSGAAIATVISRYYGFFSLASYSKRIGVHVNMKNLVKPIIASGGMAIFLWLFNKLAYTRTNIFLGAVEIIVAAAIYFLILYLIKGFSKKEIIYIVEIAKSAIRKENSSLTPVNS